jgi:MarR family transcriptional regulator for hemolysin
VYRVAAIDEPIGLFVTRGARSLSRSFDAALEAHQSNLASWLVLASLAGGLRRTQRSVADDLGIEGATLTYHLQRMESAGLVRRERDPDDRRAQQVELTDDGRATFFALLATVHDFDRQLRAGFTDRELATLRRLLGRLVDNAALPDTKETSTL